MTCEIFHTVNHIELIFHIHYCQTVETRHSADSYWIKNTDPDSNLLNQRSSLDEMNSAPAGL